MTDLLSKLEAIHYRFLEVGNLITDPYGPELVRDGISIDSLYKNEFRNRFYELGIHRKHFEELESQGITKVYSKHKI